MISLYIIIFAIGSMEVGHITGTDMDHPDLAVLELRGRYDVALG
jgi:hypothetical protein